tara:strand:+ start:1252 stop:1536 length:285 start_codon:yes stop_codon:yes gene_type:complete
MNNVTRINGNGVPLRNDLIRALKGEILAGLETHRMNVEVLLRNPTALPDHTSFMSAVKEELKGIGDCGDLLSALEYVEADEPPSSRGDGGNTED